MSKKKKDIFGRGIKLTKQENDKIQYQTKKLESLLVSLILVQRFWSELAPLGIMPIPSKQTKKKFFVFTLRFIKNWWWLILLVNSDLVYPLSNLISESSSFLM